MNNTVVRLIHSSSLTANGQTYSPTGCSFPNHYYETLELIIETAGYYRLSCNSSIGLRAHIYQDVFDPLNPSFKLRAEKDGQLGFRITLFLRDETTYVLVVTSVNSQQIGSFSIVATGPYNFSTRRIGKFVCFRKCSPLLTLLRHVTHGAFNLRIDIQPK